MEVAQRFMNGGPVKSSHLMFSIWGLTGILKLNSRARFQRKLHKRWWRGGGGRRSELRKQAGLVALLWLCEGQWAG